VSDAPVIIEIQDKVSPNVKTSIGGIASSARDADTAVSKLKAQLASIDTSAVTKLSNAVKAVSNDLLKQVDAQSKLNVQSTKAALLDAQATVQKQKLATELQKTALEQQRLATETERTNAAQSRAEAAALRLENQSKRVADAHKRQSQAVTETGTNTKLAAYQMQNLVFQLNDVVVGLASGQRPLTVLIQQGSQISTIFGPGVGVLGVLRAVGSAIGSVISATVAVVGTLLGLIAGLGAAWNSFVDSQLNVKTALAGAGRQVNLTTEQFLEMTSAASKAGKVSKGFAADFGADLARTGVLGKENIGKIIALTRDFATTVGTDVDEARKILVKTFTDPGPGIQQLNQQLQFLDGATMRHINSLILQGKNQEAVNVALEKLPPALAKAEQGTTALGRAWSSTWTGIKSLMFDIGQEVDRLVSQDTVQKLERITSRINELRNQPQRRSLLGVTDDGAKADQIAKLEEQAAKLRAEIDKLSAAGAKAASDQGLNRLGVQVTNLAQEISPTTNSLEQLRAKLAMVNNAVVDPGLRQRAGNVRDLMQAQDALTRAIESGLGVQASQVVTQDGMTRAVKEADAAGRNYLDTAQKKAALDKIDLELLNARSPAEQARLRMDRERISLAGEIITTKAAENQITQAGKIVTSEALKARQDELYEIDRQLKLMKLVGPEREIQIQLLEKELAARRANQALSPQELATLEERLKKMEGANRVQQQLEKIYNDILKPARDYNDTMVAANLLFEKGKISASQYFNALADAKIKALEATNTVASGLQAALLGVTRDLNNVAGTIKTGITSIFSSIENALVEFVKTGKLNFKDLATSIIGDIGRMIIRLLILRPIMSALFGSSALSGTGGAIGGLFGDLFKGIGIGAANGIDFIVGGKSGVDENLVPMRLSKGERVTVQTAQQQSEAARQDRNPGSNGTPVVNMYVNTPNAESFRASEGQVAAAAARAVQRGYRQL
jgi:lambda family phage tail tape measure protein